MYKEVIISLIIIISIVLGNNITQGYTKESVTELSSDLKNLKGIIEQEDNTINWEDVEKQIEEISKKWDNRYDKLAYYIEHNELEKIESGLTGLESYAKKQDSEEALNQLNNSIFVLKHIEEKNDLNLKNIF